MDEESAKYLPGAPSFRALRGRAGGSNPPTSVHVLLYALELKTETATRPDLGFTEILIA